MLTAALQQQFAQTEKERQKRIREAWARYEGDWPKDLRATRSDPEAADNVVVNLAQLIVDKGVSALFGFSLDLEVDGEADSPAEEWLGECFGRNGGLAGMMRLATNGAVAGHAFVKVVEPNPSRYGHPYPRLIQWDPACVSVRWEPDDYEQVMSYSYEWQGMDPSTARPVAYRQVVERRGQRWVIRDEVSHGMRTDWQITAETLWRWDWCPVFQCQNFPCPNAFWGKSDLEPHVLGLNRAVNFISGNLNRILRYHAHPKTWGAGFEAVEMHIGVDQMVSFPDPSARLENLEMSSDLASSLEYLRETKDALYTLTRIPEVATGKLENAGQLSGLALGILYGPLVELTATKRLLYGQLLQDLGRCLLEMGGFGAEHQVTLQWPDVVPADRRAAADTAIVLREVGVSRDTLLSELSYDPVAEKEKREAEQATERELGTRLMDEFVRKGAVGAEPGAGE